MNEQFEIAVASAIALGLLILLRMWRNRKSPGFTEEAEPEKPIPAPTPGTKPVPERRVDPREASPDPVEEPAAAPVPKSVMRTAAWGRWVGPALRVVPMTPPQVQPAKRGPGRPRKARAG